MKIFITCVVIALLVTGMLAVNWRGSESREAVRNADAAMAGQAPGEDVRMEQSFDEVTAAAEAGSKPLSGVQASPAAGEVAQGEEPLDTLQLYDTLLILNFSSEGNLLFDRNTRAALQALHEQLGGDIDDQRLGNLQALLNDALPEEAAMQLLDLLQDYAAYQQAVEDVQRAQSQEDATATNPLDNYEQLKALRRSYMDNEQVSGMYAEEEAQLPYMVESMAVARDLNLSEEERAAKLAALQEAFNDTASRMDSPLARKVLEAKVARMREGGASDAEIFAVRDAVLGSAEAQRLAEQDQVVQAGDDDGP